MAQKKLPSIYLCLLCGWEGEIRQLDKDLEGTYFICPGCKERASYLMDRTEDPAQFISIRNRSWFNSLKSKRKELGIKTTEEIKRIERHFIRIMEADP